MAQLKRRFSVVRLLDGCRRRTFLSAGLRPRRITLADGAVIFLWAPAPSPSAPENPRRPRRGPLLLIHGFGGSAIWQWGPYLRPLSRAGFELYVPDLIFFGGSAAPGPDRSETYQASCIMAAMEEAGARGGRRMFVAGVSYGGFVAYRLAAMYPDAVEKLALVAAGVSVEEGDLAMGLFPVKTVAEAAEVLVPQRPEELRELLRITFARPPPAMPACFLRDFIQLLGSNHVQEKKELLYTLIKDRKLSDLPVLTHLPTMLIWGDQDKVFPLELAHRLKRHLGESSCKLVIIQKAGHAVNMEKPKQVCKYLLHFFCEPVATAEHEQDSKPNGHHKSITSALDPGV